MTNSALPCSNFKSLSLKYRTWTFLTNPAKHSKSTYHVGSSQWLGWQRCVPLLQSALPFSAESLMFACLQQQVSLQDHIQSRSPTDWSQLLAPLYNARKTFYALLSKFPCLLTQHSPPQKKPIFTPPTSGSNKYNFCSVWTPLTC